jgi:PAS domain S-box-containing protein
MFRDKFLRNILLTSVAAVLVVPVYTAMFTYPSYKKLLIANAEDDALRLAAHMVSEILPQGAELKKGSIPDAYKKIAESMKSDFRLMKIKIYSPSGEVIYSTDDREIGTVNDQKEFHDIVTNGKNHVEFVQKNQKSLEGETVTADVVETYIPVKNNHFIGAFEIYLDITERKMNLDRLISQSYAILLAISLGLLASVMVTAFKANRHAGFQRKAEEKIEQQRDFLAKIMESLTHPFCVIDVRDYTIRLANSACGPDVVPGTSTCHAVIHGEKEPCCLAGINCPLDEVKKTGKSATVEHTHYDAMGNPKIFDVHGYPIFDANGEVAELIEYSLEVTDRKDAENALRQSEERFRKIFEEGPLGMGVVSLDCRFGKVNGMLCQMLGYTEEELSARTFKDITHPDDTNAALQNVQRLLRREKPSFEMEKRYVRKNGEILWAHLTASLLCDAADNPMHFLVMVEDISKRKNLESQLFHSQKMEAIGQLAGGIAHDFNNLLCAIIGFASLAEMKMGKEDPALSYLEHILAAADRATHLTQGLLAFSRRQIINPQPVDLNGIVSNVEKLLSRLITEEIELKVSLADRNLIVMADASQIDQVLMNLATNARDAMPGGGVLSVETSLVELTGGYLLTHRYCAAGRYALLAVSDSGVGMEGATRERIFEPFFTTKEVGKGTGLGLAIIYGIVKQHNGYINVYSEQGEGSTFKVYLPLVEEETASGQMHEAPKAVLDGTETVLVVEDNPDVRDLTTSLLEAYGYRVIEALDGRDGVEKFALHQDEVKLVIMDVIMPKLNGKEAFAEMRRLRPGVKVLFTSGYTPDIVHKKGILLDGSNFVAKPAPPQLLLKKIRDILAGE